jgi:hypothetical protein
MLIDKRQDPLFPALESAATDVILEILETFTCQTSELDPLILDFQCCSSTADL